MSEPYIVTVDRMMTYIEKAQNIVNPEAFSSKKYSNELSKLLRQLTSQLGYFHITGGLVKKTYNNNSSELYQFLNYGKGFNVNILDYLNHIERGYLTVIFFWIEKILAVVMGKKLTEKIGYHTLVEKFSSKVKLDENEKNTLRYGSAVRNSFHNGGIHIHPGFSAIIDEKELKLEQNKEIDTTLMDIPIAVYGAIDSLIKGLKKLYE